MRSGKLRVRVNVQEPVSSRGDTGAEEVTFQTVVRRRVRMRLLSATESHLAGVQTTGLATHEFVLRYEKSLSDLNPKWQITLGSREFDILAVDNIRQQNRELIVRGVERTP